MTARPVEDIVKALKEIVEKNGPNYLAEEPFQVYTELIRSGNADRKTAAALLHLFASGLLETTDPGYDAELLSDSIRKECSLNKRMADRLAIILHTLSSQDNKREWRSKEKEGLTQFLNEDFLYDWKGFAVWDAGNGTVDCHYEARIIVKHEHDGKPPYQTSYRGTARRLLIDQETRGPATGPASVFICCFICDFHSPSHRACPAPSRGNDPAPSESIPPWAGSADRQSG